MSRLLRSRGGWALADQAVVSLGNCFTAIILAGTLPVHDYGVFILVFGMLVFLNSLHASLVTYPLSVRGASAPVDDLRSLAGHSLLFTLALALPLSIGVIIIVCVEDRPTLIPWAIGAMVLWQIQETVRRAIMAHLRHRDALLGDALSYLGQAGLLWALASRGSLTLETAFMSIAVTSLLGTTFQALRLRPAIKLATQWRTPQLVREHWTMGRWMLLTNLITLVTVQAMPWTLAYFHGNEEVAHFGVLAQVMGLTNPIIISVAGLVVPAVAAAASRGTFQQGLKTAKRTALVYGLQGAALLLPYYAAVVILPELALRIFSKNNPAYTGLTTHLRLFVLVYAMVFPAQVMQALFNGLRRSRYAFMAQCAFSVATLLLSIPLAAKWGLTGAVWSGALPALVYVGTSLVMLRKASFEPPEIAAPREARGFEVIPANPLTGSRATPEGASAA